MKRSEILTIQSIKEVPSLTITLPTHRTSPENHQDAIRVRNLSDQAVNRLLKEFNRRELAPLLDRLEKLLTGLDYRNMLDGLALFVNNHFSRTISLPFTLKERVNIGETFLTRDLVYALNRTPRYWVLVLSEQPTRLYEGTYQNLTEVQTGGFPITHQGPGGEQPLPGGFGIKKSAYRDEYLRKFFRQVNTALKSFFTEDPLPLVVVGVDRFLAFFNEVTDYRDSILVTIKGSHDKTSPHDLVDLVWPRVKKALAGQRRQFLAELDKAVGERKFVSTAGEVWRLAHEGRGRILLVEEDFHFPARVDETGRHLIPADENPSPGVMDDAVDDMIETVLQKQGRVVFVGNGQLKVHQGIALILRY